MGYIGYTACIMIHVLSLVQQSCMRIQGLERNVRKFMRFKRLYLGE